MKELLEQLIKELVDKPDEVVVTEVETERMVISMNCALAMEMLARLSAATAELLRRSEPLFPPSLPKEAVSVL